MNQPEVTEDGTIEVDLTNPAHARWYCRDVYIEGRGYIDHVKVRDDRTGEERTINFKDMSDDDAVTAAHLLYDLVLQRDAMEEEKQMLADGGLLQ